MLGTWLVPKLGFARLVVSPEVGHVVSPEVGHLVSHEVGHVVSPEVGLCWARG